MKVKSPATETSDGPKSTSDRPPYRSGTEPQTLSPPQKKKTSDKTERSPTENGRLLSSFRNLLSRLYPRNIDLPHISPPTHYKQNVRKHLIPPHAHNHPSIIHSSPTSTERTGEYTFLDNFLSQERWKISFFEHFWKKNKLFPCLTCSLSLTL